MGQTEESVIVGLPPGEAMELWTDIDRWPAFVDGFGRVLEAGPGWPATGTPLVWESTPGGRGRVTERVEAYEAPPPGPDVAPQSHPGRFVTRVEDESLRGEQAVSFEPAPEGTRVRLTLEYELAGGGLLQPVTDFLFIRRALRDSLRRTLGSFVAEADEVASEEPEGRQT